MLFKETFQDVVDPTTNTSMRCYILTPRVPNYSNAQFPGVIVYSEIYQVTGPVRRFAQQICSKGYVVICPDIYHNFVPPGPLSYDNEGTDLGNKLKITKPLESYDTDNKLCVDLLYQLPQFNKRKIGVTGMCLGGHLAFRGLLDSRISCATCFFPTDVHSKTLGLNTNDDTLERICLEMDSEKQEALLIFGTKDPHVPVSGRTKIREALNSSGKRFSFLELLDAQHAFIRDESSKDRYDAVVTNCCLQFMWEQFERCLKTELNDFKSGNEEVKNVC